MPSWEVNFDLHVDTTRPSIITDLERVDKLSREPGNRVLGY